jgi:DNA polymerase elongation subunit (family B)
MKNGGGDTIVFNALDWYEGDEFPGGQYDKDGKRYVIRIFGRTAEGKSVAVRVDNFTPFFFVEIPDDWDKRTADRFCDYVIDACKDKDKGKVKSLRGGFFDKDPTYHTRHLIACDVVERYKFHGFTAGKKFKFIRFVFNNMAAMKRMARLFQEPIEFQPQSTANIICARYQIYESNIDPYLRFIHIRDLDSCGWICINEYQDNYEGTTTDINIVCDWKKVSKEDKIGIAPFKIASFDIECTSGDGSFPLAQRLSDKIIQIGTTFTKYGNTEPYLKTIITLGTCDAIEDTRVIACKTEREVLVQWHKLIQEEDPDILTGYNIFNFDEKYMYDRAKLESIDCLEELSRLSRMSDWCCEWRESNLSSSSLGDNILRFFRTPGRIQIDLMKVVQRDHKLPSYKLDSVAETFIKEPIISLKYDGDIIVIETKNTHTVKVGNFVKIEDHGEYIEDKMQIVKITDTLIHVRPEVGVEIDPNSKLYWGLVKDDIHPNDIFRLQKGTAKDRKTIAVYCIQDCVLVGKLMAKLDVIVNNMSMANVCYVPVSYIFLRGQGIKSLSLVSKECRRKNFLIPLIKKANNSDSDKEEDVGYEGATVFEPHIGFHKVPVSVLDFNSLYPSSEIAYNMSHETIVLDARYDNLPDYTYKEIEFRNLDDTRTKCRFAKHKNGEFGIIPSILDKLIKGRKETKKQMEAESDPFKKSILDGKQNALKVTANSLYGQLGAATSPICMKELAASTTAVGRLMLETARDFVQGRFVEILEAIYEGKDTESILDKELEDRKNTKFIEMLTKTVDDVFDSHYIKPVVIYGDSVAGYMPILLRDAITGRVIVKTIDSFYQEAWKPYDGFKMFEHGITDKEQSMVTDYDAFTSVGWKPITRVIRHKCNKKMYRVTTASGSFVDVTEDHSLLDITQQEIKPEYVMGAELLTMKDAPCIPLFVDDANDAHYVKLQKKWHNTGHNANGTVVSVREVYYTDDYVYDLETEAGNFQAGVGDIIVKNTDSIFIKMNITDRETQEVRSDKQSLDWSIKLAMAASKLLKIRLPPPENMEYEKTFYPFAIMAKKKYVGNKYEDNPDKFKQASMGIVLKRRDNANIVKKIIGGIIDIMMNKMDTEETKRFAKQFVKDMLKGKYPIKDFITTKTLKGSYKVTMPDKDGNKVSCTVNVTDALKDVTEIEGMCTPDLSEAQKNKIREYHQTEAAKLDKVSMAHVKLAKRMADRDPGNKPQINERIPFVTIEKYKPRGVKLLQGDMIEHPDYIKANNLHIDYLFYLTNQIVNPAVQILDLIIDDSKEKLFMKTINKYKDRRKERDAQEADRIKAEQTIKINNERVEKFNWVHVDSDEDETQNWLSSDAMLKIVQETKPVKKKRGAKLRVKA